MSAAPLATLARFGQRAARRSRDLEARRRPRAPSLPLRRWAPPPEPPRGDQDMDGTLTVPNHDFAEMYRRVGCKTKDILTEIEGWPEAERARANSIIHEMETEALATMQRMPGAARLGAFLDAKGVPRDPSIRTSKPPSRTSTPTPGRSPLRPSARAGVQTP